MRFIKDLFVSYWDPTIEDAYSKEVTIKGETSKIKILDTAGQDSFESMRAHWIQEKDAYVLVFSLDDADSFKELSRFLDLIKEVCVKENKLRKPIMLVGNKSDLFHSTETNGQTTTKTPKVLDKDIRPFIERAQFEIEYVKVSAKTGDGVNCVFNKLVEKLIDKEKETVKTIKKEVNRKTCVLL
eukprot:maker-scaffold_2-augustus-gene-15.28-mRNA-1 protein AED:0.23 eAED:0.23 QI:252/0/1/1/0/1/2/60/183